MNLMTGEGHERGYQHRPFAKLIPIQRISRFTRIERTNLQESCCLDG